MPAFFPRVRDPILAGCEALVTIVDFDCTGAGAVCSVCGSTNVEAAEFSELPSRLKPIALTGAFLENDGPVDGPSFRIFCINEDTIRKEGCWRHIIRVPCHYRLQI